MTDGGHSKLYGDHLDKKPLRPRTPRQRTADIPTAMFLRTGRTSQSRYVGATQDLDITWHVDRHATVRFISAYYEVGSYLRETQPPGKDATYFSVIASYKF